MSSFCVNLKKARIDAGYKSARQAALALGISPTTYQGYEAGERFPRKEETIRELAEFFSCTTDYLLGHTLEPNLVEYRDLPESLKEVGAEAVILTAEALEAGLSPEDLRDLIEAAKRIKNNK